jgi:hypothetical protein
MIRSTIAILSVILAAQTPIRVPEPIRVPVSRIIGQVTVRQTGLPVEGLTVWAFRKGYNEEAVPIATRVSSAVTDEQGQYYIPLAAAGRYYLITSSFARNGSFAPTFYPGDLDESRAKPIDVSPGKDAAAIDFAVNRAQGVSISGRLLDGLGRRLPHMDWVWLVRRPSFAENMSMGGGKTRFENVDRYEIEDVLPGMYYLCAYRFDDESHRADTVVPILVGDEDMKIDLVSNASYDITGRFLFEGPRIGLGPPASTIRVSAHLVDDPDRVVSAVSQQARIRREGTFGFMPLPAGRFRVSVLGVPAPYYVKSVRSGSIDVLQNGLTLGTENMMSMQIVISNNSGQVAGAVFDGSGQPTWSARIVLIPKRTGVLRPDLYKADTPDVNGQFSITGVAPGDYFIYAWDKIEPGEHFNPEFISRFEGLGTPVQVTAGAVTNVKLTRIDNRE